ncbi:3-hydroxyacyl-ACP dehydratase FabZ family protein [Streptomyces sp. NPDC048219]|uniref:3-hydroxyacyl-ACP dehydratase FabZ family protein n=1 Tax=unclassified Streptomyces TaxID=2593676 RepID=UPI0034294B5E
MTTQAVHTTRPPVLPAGLDRLLEWEPGRRAVAVRNVPATWPVFDHHFPRHPVLPGVLLLESMAALARTTAHGTHRRLVSVRGVRFKHFVAPGDQVRISVEVTATSKDTTEVRAAARVADRVVATARALVLARDDEPREGTS